MFYHGSKSYPGRWIVKLVEAFLVVGIVFFSLDAILNTFLPRDGIIFETTWVEPIEVQIHPPVAEFGHPLPMSAYDYMGMAFDHQMSGQYYDAIMDYTRVLEMEPAISSAWLNRGVAYEQAGNRYHAMQDFNQFMNRPDAFIMTTSDLQNGGTAHVEMSEGAVFEFIVEARAGQVISASATSAEPYVVDPLMVLVDSKGQPVIASDDMLRQDGSLISMDAHINNYTVIRSGTYVLRVSHAGGGSYGQVDINIDLRNN